MRRQSSAAWRNVANTLEIISDRVKIGRVVFPDIHADTHTDTLIPMLQTVITLYGAWWRLLDYRLIYVCAFSNPATRISYFVYNSSSTSPVKPGSSGVTEPTNSDLRPYLSFAGYNGAVYSLLSPSTETLYSRKRAFAFLVVERISSEKQAQLPFMLETVVREREFRCVSLFHTFDQPISVS